MEKQVSSVDHDEIAHHQAIATIDLDDLCGWFKRAFFEPIGSLLRAIASGNHIAVHFALKYSYERGTFECQIEAFAFAIIRLLQRSDASYCRSKWIILAVFEAIGCGANISAKTVVERSEIGLAAVLKLWRVVADQCQFLTLSKNNLQIRGLSSI